MIITTVTFVPAPLQPHYWQFTTFIIIICRYYYIHSYYIIEPSTHLYQE